MDKQQTIPTLIECLLAVDMNLCIDPIDDKRLRDGGLIEDVTFQRPSEAGRQMLREAGYE